VVELTAFALVLAKTVDDNITTGAVLVTVGQRYGCMNEKKKTDKGPF